MNKINITLQCSHFQIRSVEKRIREFFNSYEGKEGNKMLDLWSSLEMFTLDSVSRRDVLTSLLVWPPHSSSLLGCCSPEAVCDRRTGADVKSVNLAPSSAWLWAPFASAAFPSSEMLLRKERAACLCLWSISTGKKTWQKCCSQQLLPQKTLSWTEAHFKSHTWFSSQHINRVSQWRSTGFASGTKLSLGTQYSTRNVV